MPAHHAQSAAGVVFNVRPNLPRSEYDSLKALLFNCIRFGPESQNRVPVGDLQSHLRGEVAYAAMINPVRGRKLLGLLDQINWEK